MAIPANAAVRETRRRSTPLDVESVNVIKALTTAEYSRRQFILNFAASRNTQLLIPGRKSEAVKAAEQWAARHLHLNGHRALNNDFFKYLVDEYLWATHVGDDIPFPFAFMHPRPASYEEAALSPRVEFHERIFDSKDAKAAVLPASTSAPLLAAAPPSVPPPTQPRQEASANQQQQQPPPQPESSSPSPDFKRSMSLSSVDEIKARRKLGPEKSPFLVRLGRSWSRRFSSAF
ncbi:hypothetical protein VTJ83DRAFT_154 [Remersonia thermophila]|uniref:Uncharacterized protein n=1 Tax=Remersonia thermophila TaxID=72144 RepID=A0ABR4DKA8_9PEZI